MTADSRLYIRICLLTKLVQGEILLVKKLASLKSKFPSPVVDSRQRQFFGGDDSV